VRRANCAVFRFDGSLIKGGPQERKEGNSPSFPLSPVGVSIIRERWDHRGREGKREGLSHLLSVPNVWRRKKEKELGKRGKRKEIEC